MEKPLNFVERFENLVPRIHNAKLQFSLISYSLAACFVLLCCVIVLSIKSLDNRVYAWCGIIMFVRLGHKI